jgi:transcriptional regulator with GAF, ATPase, and Fis domain
VADESTPTGDPRTLFAGLAAIVYDHRSFPEIYQAVCDSAVVLVPGCDHASIMLRARNSFITAAASDDVAKAVDELERRHGEGPCVDAIVDDTPQLDVDLQVDPTWPKLAASVLTDTPVRAVAGFRLRVDHDKVGALNLFSDTRNGLDTRSVDAAIMLSTFASVALLAAHRSEQASSLRNGLESNREIGKAIGLLMAFHKISEDAAFEMLRKASSEMNLKIAEVAKNVVDHERSRKR